MKITKVWAVYFSPTGNAKKVVTTMAKRAAECLGVPMGTVDFTLPENREGVVSFDKEDLAFFSTPVYAGRIPNKMLPYVQTAFEGNGALAVAVSVFGNRNFDNGLIELRNELEAHGFHTVAGAGIPTEHVFSSKLATGRPDADDLVKIAEFGEKVAEKVSGLTEIPEKIAGLLCAAIISDTLMFRSPTCTQTDKIAASALALIAGIKIEEFAREMFSAGSNLKDKSPEEIFYQDYKKFIAEGDVCFGVGQISSMDADELKEIKERLIPFMVSECGRHGVSRVYFMLTNIMEQSTELLFYGEGSEEMAVNAFKMQPENGTIYLKGVVSRKKQLIPPLMEAAQMSGSDYV